MNCHYYNENGEPGYCAALDATWSAHIKPWPEAISNGSKYTDITDKGFKIEGVDSEEVGAWENLQFGIITDDRASCKLDTVHTKTIDEMKYNFVVDNQIGCASESCGSQGTNHKIVLSPFVNANSSSASMPPLVEGENNYYIRCRNFAGAVNEGEFAVKIVRGKEPDVTSPIITRFDPADYQWVKQGENSSFITFFVNEPSTCKYSQGVDNRYEDMTGNASCYTDPDFGVMGEWACFTPVANLIAGDNKFYFQCKDQPDIDPRMTSKQNINRNSKEYTVKVCSSGLNITSLEPKNIPLVGQAPISMTMTASTKGCVNGGVASCAYSFNNHGENATYIEFLNTNSLTHSQTFTSMPAGINNISVRCADVAGNIAYNSLMVNVTIDNAAPVILRAYDLNNQLTVTTNENSKCKYTANESVGCDFDFEGSNSSIIIMNGEGTTHTSPWIDSQEYYIKCQDVFGNTNSLCGISIKAS
jgi:hypothetical protein